MKVEKASGSTSVSATARLRYQFKVAACLGKMSVRTVGVINVRIYSCRKTIL